MSKHSGDSGRGKTPFYEEETSGRNWLREGRPPAVTSGERRQEVKKNAYDKKPCLKQVIMSNIILNYL